MYLAAEARCRELDERNQKLDKKNHQVGLLLAASHRRNARALKKIDMKQEELEKLKRSRQYVFNKKALMMNDSSKAIKKEKKKLYKFGEIVAADAQK